MTKAGKGTVLHSFTGGSSDGAFPYLEGVLMDAKGNLYGDATQGGDPPPEFDGGVVYKLGKSGALTVLHSFGKGTDGFGPYGTPVMDKQGNLYGTIYGGGSSGGLGTVWKVSKKGKETVLHSFAGGASDGAYPYAGVIMDAKGNLYGVTAAGGSGTACGQYACGTVYELSKNGTLTVLHTSPGRTGNSPPGGLILDANGNLYGTTMYGGSSGYGTAWKLTP